MDRKELIMKNFYYLLVCALVLIYACSTDSNDSSSSDSAGDGQGGSLATFALKGNYLYTVNYYNLNVFGIADVTNPVKLNTVDVGFDIETLFGFKDYLFIGSQSAMFIYDISNPEFPVKLSQSDHFRSCDPVVANDDYAFVTLHTNTACEGTVNELRTYDIADLENPILLNTRGLTEPKGLGLFDDYLLVCDNTTKIFDVSNASESVFITEIPTDNAIDIIIRDNHAFIISEDSIDQYELDATDMTNFKAISSFVFNEATIAL